MNFSEFKLNNNKGINKIAKSKSLENCIETITIEVVYCTLSIFDMLIIILKLNQEVIYAIKFLFCCNDS